MSQIINSDMTVRGLYDSYGMNNEKLFFTWLYDFLDDNSITPPDWLTASNAVILDIAYVFEHSGDKHLSRFITRVANGQTSFQPSMENNVAMVAWAKFKDKWEKEYAALTASYNPIENYDSTEEITRSGDDKVSTNVNMDATGYDKAFNSSDLEAVSKSHTEGTGTNNYSRTDWNSKIKTEKHGNIGVTTSQQMLESEIELRNKWNFYEIMFNDVDSLITTNLY